MIVEWLFPMLIAEMLSCLDAFASASLAPTNLFAGDFYDSVQQLRRHSQCCSATRDCRQCYGAKDRSCQRPIIL
jgi:hypothetical protein